MSILTRARHWFRQLRLTTRLRGWWRQWRRKRAAKRHTGMLREFVYLDEVSVYSLIASRLGPVATEFTDKEVTSLKAEIPKSITGSLESSSQVVRKSIVQTTFKELYELERESLAIRPIETSLKLPQMQNIDELMGLRESLTSQDWIIDPENLSRGQMLEMEVELEAEDIYRVNTVIWALLDIVQDDLEVFGLVADKNFDLAKTAGRVLDKLLVGLVPIRGSAVDYTVVVHQGKEWIIHHKVLNQLPAIDSSHRFPLYVVGVAEKSLFWKDVRRILFSNARFRVLCRTAQGGIHDSWRPVKLTHAMSQVLPDVGRAIDRLGSDMLTSMAKSTQADQGADRSRHLMQQALIIYGELLAGHYGHSISQQELLEGHLLTEQRSNSYSNLKERRAAFNAVAEFVLDRFEIERDQNVVAQYRLVALADAGLDCTGQPIPLAKSNNHVDTALSIASSTEERFIDSEFIAIYW